MERNTDSTNIAKLLASFSLLAFLLSVVWEILHGAYLYETCSEHVIASLSPQAFATLSLVAAVLDALLLLLVVLIGNFVFADSGWVLTMNFAQWVYLGVVTLGLAAVIEVTAVQILGFWSYNPQMPTVLGVGVSPLVQLFVTAIVAIGIIHFVRKL